MSLVAGRPARTPPCERPSIFPKGEVDFLSTPSADLPIKRTGDPRMLLLKFYDSYSMMTGSNIRCSAAVSPITSTFTPVPVGTQPSPKALSKATFASKPEQCIGRIYVGAGRSLLAKKSTVGAIRSRRSGVLRCKPPIICLPLRQRTR